MNAPHEPRRRDVLLAALAMLGGCGGVDSGGTGTGAASTYATGTILGFGSIIVNGVRFDDATAQIDDDDGIRLLRTDLALGMRAEIIASAVTTVGGVASATAASIRVQRAIVGPLEHIDTAAAQLTVLGQTVAVVSTTVVDPSISGGLASLAIGEIIEAFATLDLAAGRYVASRIARRAGVAAFTLRGAVASLSLTSRTLTIGQLIVDWSAVAPAQPATALAVGRLIRLTLATAPIAGVWQATALSSAQPMPDDREAAEVEGRITAFTSEFAFELAGLPVNASGASFPDGSAALALGVAVEVYGSVRNGILLATRVEIEEAHGGGDPAAFELHGRIESIDAAASRFVVRGVTVAWSALTQFESSAAADIQIGREVEVKGRLSADGSLIEATSVHVES
jgi:hypothetical protein